MRRVVMASFWAGCVAASALVVGQTPTPSGGLAIGISQVQEGEAEQAVITLDQVVDDLAGRPSRRDELIRAYIYLGVAYAALGQREKGKAQFVEAWRLDNSLTLSNHEFPPAIVGLYEETRREAEEKAVGSPARGRSKLPFAVGGTAAAAGIATAIALAGGSETSAQPSPTPTPTPEPTPEPVDLTGHWFGTSTCTTQSDGCQSYAEGDFDLRQDGTDLSGTMTSLVKEWPCNPEGVGFGQTYAITGEVEDDRNLHMTGIADAGTRVEYIGTYSEDGNSMRGTASAVAGTEPMSCTWEALRQ